MLIVEQPLLDRACLEPVTYTPSCDATPAALSPCSIWEVFRLRDRPMPGRRFIAAWLYDYLACYWLANLLIGAIVLIFGASFWEVAPLQLVTMSIFLTRDFFFQGRGVGKYLLGLQTVDCQTGISASFSQSVRRNLVLLGPYLLYQVIAQFMICFPEFHNQVFLDCLKAIGLAYALPMMVSENYLMYRGSGRRIADRFAGTIVVRQAAICSR